VKPFTNFFRVRTEDCDVETGWGAWEVAWRWDYVDMYDAAGAHTPTVANNGFSTIGWGRANAQTIGLNWYLKGLHHGPAHLRTRGPAILLHFRFPGDNGNVEIPIWIDRTRLVGRRSPGRANARPGQRRRLWGSSGLRRRVQRLLAVRRILQVLSALRLQARPRLPSLLRDENDH